MKRPTLSWGGVKIRPAAGGLVLVGPDGKTRLTAAIYRTLAEAEAGRRQHFRTMKRSAAA